MNRLIVVSVIAGGLFAGSSGFAADSQRTWSTKRQYFTQVVGCMKKRMAADKGISYNQAAKVCKDQVTRQHDGPEAGPLVAADTQH